MLRLCLALMIVLSGCSPAAKDGQKNAPLVRLTDNDSRGLDPQIVSDISSTRIASDLFEGLTRFNANGEAEAGLAERWTISADGRVWTFQLRPNLKFSDGSAITATVFSRAFARIKDEKSGSPHGALFAIITAVDAPDDRNVRVHLTDPFPALPSLLAHPAMAALPFHRIDAAGDKWTADRPLVTSGPYRLTQWQLAQSLHLAANPHWHDGAPPSPTMIWRPMENLNAAMRAVLAGSADIGSDYPPTRHHWLQTHYPAMVHSHPYLGTYYYAFNTRRPPFDDRRVRLALSMAIDRQWMANKMIDAGNEPAWGLLPPALAGGFPYRPIWAEWPRQRRLGAARGLMAEAGYGPRNPLRFEIRFNSSSEHRKAAVAMATMWRDLGVEASLLNSEASLHFDSLKRADFALARSGWIADLAAPENFLSVHKSDTGAQNYSGFANHQFDTQLNAALAEADPKIRVSMMRDAEQTLMDESPILPLYYYASRALVSPRVRGWVDNPANVHPSRTLTVVR